MTGPLVTPSAEYSVADSLVLGGRNAKLKGGQQHQYLATPNRKIKPSEIMRPPSSNLHGLTTPRVCIPCRVSASNREVARNKNAVISRLMTRVLRHPRLWRHAVLSSAAPLHVALVGQCLRRVDADVGHVVRRHVWVGRHPGAWLLLGREVLARRFLRRLDLVRLLNAILVPGCGLGRVQAGLCAPELVPASQRMRRAAPHWECREGGGNRAHEAGAWGTAASR